MWYDAVIKGDLGRVVIGKGSNVQDRALINGGSLDFANVEDHLITSVGEYVTIGHAAVVERAIVGDHALVGNGAIVGEGSVLEPYSMLAAGAVLGSGQRVLSKQLWSGNPAKFQRNLSEAEIENLNVNALEYEKLGELHKNDTGNYLKAVRLEAMNLLPAEPEAFDTDGGIYQTEISRHN